MSPQKTDNANATRFLAIRVHVSYENNLRDITLALVQHAKRFQ